MLTQYGTIACRRSEDGRIRILLITSRETRRWVVPRGNAIPGLTPGESAAQEAYEEAGVRGTVSPHSVGSYRYDKRRRSGAVVPTRVELYRLEVLEELADWPEQAERERRWFGPAEAADAVDEPELKALLLAFAAGGEGR